MTTTSNVIEDHLSTLISTYQSQLENIFDINLTSNGSHILLIDTGGKDLTITGGKITLNSTDYTRNVDSSLADATIDALIVTYNGVVKKYNQINTSYDVIFQNQNTLANIVNTEQDRLEQKKELVDTSIFEQKRAQSLNESYRQKYNYYIYIIVAFILLFVSFIVIGEVSKTITFIPSVVYDLLYIVSISLVGFFIYFTMIDIARRDHMDFSKINVNAPKGLTADELTKQRESNYSGEFDMMPNFCVGSDCCDTSGNTPTQWNAVTGRCEYSAVTTTPVTTTPVTVPTTTPESFKMKFDHSYSPIQLKNEVIDSKQYNAFNTIDKFEYV